MKTAVYEQSFYRGIFLDFFGFFHVLYSTLLHLPLSGSTVSGDTGIEPRTVGALALAVRRSNYSDR